MVSKKKIWCVGLKGIYMVWSRCQDRDIKYLVGLDEIVDSKSIKHIIIILLIFYSYYIVLFLYVDNILIFGSNMKKILSMKFNKDKNVSTLKFSQVKKVEKIFLRFNMSETKPIFTPFAHHFQLSKKQLSKSKA